MCIVEEVPSTLQPLGRRYSRPADFPSGRGFFCFTPGMVSRIAALFTMLILALAPPVLASGKKEVKASITFHMETEATDNPKMIFPRMANGKQRFFRRLPEFGTKDILSFNPFPAETGGDYGILLKLKGGAINRLAAISNANQGRWMIASVNGQIVDGVFLDRQIDDGVLVIWKGVSLADITLLEESLPRAGAEGKKKK